MATLFSEAISEKELVLLSQRGDRSAFGELARRHYQGVVRVVYQYCSDVSIAEDAAQEAFIRAWQNLPSFRLSTPFRAWLFRIAINAALDVLRRKPEESIEEVQLLKGSDPAGNPETALMAKEQELLVRRALQNLPDASRSVLILREYGALSYQEIAAALEIPVGTVMSRLNYARSLLRKSLLPLLEMESSHD